MKREEHLLEYRLFKTWFEHRRKDDPRTAITASLARDIACLVYDKDSEVKL